MKFNSLGHNGEGETRWMEYKEDKSLNAVNVWGALAIHPPSLAHSLSVWPYPTCMTRDHSSSLHPFITPVTSSFHFSAPRPELPSLSQMMSSEWITWNIMRDVWSNISSQRLECALSHCAVAIFRHAEFLAYLSSVFGFHKYWLDCLLSSSISWKNF